MTAEQWLFVVMNKPKHYVQIVPRKEPFDPRHCEGYYDPQRGLYVYDRAYSNSIGRGYSRAGPFTAEVWLERVRVALKEAEHDP
jgi:hypothetical protein